MSAFDSDPAYSPSYGQLAATRVPAAFARLVQAVRSELSSDTRPHETRDLRRLVGNTRDLLDIFCFAYPNKDGDLLLSVRQALSRGYRAVGDFKDLFDSQEVASPDEARYDQHEVLGLRQDILDWKAELLFQHEPFERFLARPKPRRIVERSGENLSPFFWGRYGARTRPVADESGRHDGPANMRRLLYRLCDRMVAEVKGATSAEGGIGNIAGAKRKHQDAGKRFHLLRKQLRTIVKLHGHFPLPARAGMEPIALVAAIERFVVSMGDLNNSLLGHERTPDGFEKTPTASDINDRWQTIKGELHTEDLGLTLTALGRLARLEPPVHRPEQ